MALDIDIGSKLTSQKVIGRDDVLDRECDYTLDVRDLSDSPTYGGLDDITRHLYTVKVVAAPQEQRKGNGSDFQEIASNFAASFIGNYLALKLAEEGNTTSPDALISQAVDIANYTLDVVRSDIVTHDNKLHVKPNYYKGNGTTTHKGYFSEELVSPMIIRVLEDIKARFEKSHGTDQQIVLPKDEYDQSVLETSVAIAVMEYDHSKDKVTVYGDNIGDTSVRVQVTDSQTRETEEKYASKRNTVENASGYDSSLLSHVKDYVLSMLGRVKDIVHKQKRGREFKQTFDKSDGSSRVEIGYHRRAPFKVEYTLTSTDEQLEVRLSTRRGPESVV